MPFLMIRNDITKVKADVIVNPANKKLLEGSGTSKAIYSAAGEQNLIDACSKIGHCDLGKAVITSAFNLQSKYIIHAVCPKWIDGNHNEENMLYSTYFESMKLAVQYKCESIAFPLLSSGNYGYPKDQAMKVALSVISNFLLDHELLVYMVLYDNNSLNISKKLFTSIKEYIDDHYVEENDEQFVGEEDNIRISGRRDFEQCKSILQAPITRRSLDSLMNNLDETFSEMLLRLIDERGLKDSTVYKKANINRKHFSKIRNDVDYCPTKKTVFAFIIALELSMDEAVDLLNKAGFAISNSSKFDIIISYFIHQKNYDLYEINEVLFKYEQPLLGEQ